MKKIPILFLLTLLSVAITSSQWGDRFKRISETNMNSYIQPLVTSIGTIMNSATYHSADVANIFGFSFSIKGMYISIPEDNLYFTPILPDGYTASVKTATFYGDKGGAYAGPAGYITFPPGINVKGFPMVMPQVGLSVFGTEALLRFIPDIKIGDEKFRFFGIGVKHKVSKYITLIPVDVSAQILYSKINISSMLNVKNLAFNVHTSKTFGIVTPYAGLQYESTKLDLTYDIEGDPLSGDPLLRQDRKINLSIDGKNNFRAVLGTSLKLAIMVFNVDVSLGSQIVFGGGLSFEF